MSLDYRWVLPERLAAGAHPACALALEDALRLLHRNGVRAIVTLYEQPLDSQDLAAAGLRALHIPVGDFSAPTLAQLQEGVDYIAACAERAEPVYVHCWAGIGRTGTLVAAYLISEGASLREAVNRIRALRPGSIESAEQLERLRQFAAMHGGER